MTHAAEHEMHAFVARVANMKVLIADADPEGIANLKQTFGNLPDFEIKEAHCGTDAWMMLTTFRDGFDAAIIDLSLPDMDGIELLKKIRARATLHSIAVVVHTAINDRSTVINCLMLGVRHYVVKPTTPEAVYLKLQEALAARSTNHVAALKSA